uniref:Uncharacterized protein n=1 Tax=Arundo donax TaxID=35708 RepID=A0A0A9F0H8_ARUDO
MLGARTRYEYHMLCNFCVAHCYSPFSNFGLMTLFLLCAGADFLQCMISYCLAPLVFSVKSRGYLPMYF